MGRSVELRISWISWSLWKHQTIPLKLHSKIICFCLIGNRGEKSLILGVLTIFTSYINNYWKKKNLVIDGILWCYHDLCTQSISWICHPYCINEFVMKYRQLWTSHEKAPLDSALATFYLILQGGRQIFYRWLCNQ